MSGLSEIAFLNKLLNVMLLPMTKVDITFKLSRPLTDKDLKSISRIHAVYGMFSTQVLPSGDELFVEYDASRLNAKEVRGTLEEHGLPLQ